MALSQETTAWRGGDHPRPGWDPLRRRRPDVAVGWATRTGQGGIPARALGCRRGAHFDLASVTKPIDGGRHGAIGPTARDPLGRRWRRRGDPGARRRRSSSCWPTDPGSKRTCPFTKILLGVRSTTRPCSGSWPTRGRADATGAVPTAGTPDLQRSGYILAGEARARAVASARDAGEA